MNHYTQLLLFIKELAETHPLVNTVTHGNVDNLDLDKSNIFPLVHISISDAQFNNGQTLTFPITIECLSERDFNKEIITNKFWGQDNEVDNHNETLAILNFMWTSIYRDWNDNNLTTSENATAEKIEFAKGNILDGWSLSFDVEVPNTELCLDLIAVPEYTLTTTVSAGGTLAQNPAGSTFSQGELVSFCAEADNGFVIDTLTINGVATSNPFSIIFNEAKTIILDFIAGGLTQKLKTFITAPVLRGLRYFFGDYSGNDNDVLVKNQRVGRFTASSYISTGQFLQGSTPFSFQCYFKANNTNTLNRIFRSTNGLAANNGIEILITGGIIRFTYVGGGISTFWTPTYLTSGEWYYLNINWSGLVSDTITMQLNESTFTHTALSQFAGISAEAIAVGFNVSGLDGIISYAKLLNGASQFEYVISHGQGATIYNLLDPTGATNGTVIGAVLATFWGSISDEAYPYEHILGATLYRNDSDSTILPICVNTSQVITGFTRLGYFPPASGILKGLPNTYHISGVDAIIPEGDYTADQIGAFVESANLELIQTEFAVQSLIVNE